MDPSRMAESFTTIRMERGRVRRGLPRSLSARAAAGAVTSRCPAGRERYRLTNPGKGRVTNGAPAAGMTFVQNYGKIRWFR